MGSSFRLFFCNLDFFFPTKRLWKSLWICKIQIIYNVVLVSPELHVPPNVILEVVFSKF